MSRRSNDKNQAILKALLKEDGNGHCADCKTATHPRWASWNLGIFICIRCSGIHRSMGTHISRVKSVDLDTWTDEQVASMVKWGNNSANVYWESKLPGGSHVPDDSKIENFIRTKYDLKKWVSSSTVPDPSTLSTKKGNNQPNLIVNTSVKSNNPSTNASNNQQENRRSVNSSLLDLEFGSPIAAPSKSQHAQQLQGSQFAVPQSINNQQQTQQQHISSTPSPSLQTQASGSRDNSRPELKKSILSLYSTPLTASNSTPNFPLHQPAQQQQFYNQQKLQPSAVNSYSSSNSLSGLNFQNNSTSSFTQQSSTLNNNYNQNNSSNQWNNTNQWASTTTNNTTQSSKPLSNPLDDALFKNVWQ